MKKKKMRIKVSKKIRDQEKKINLKNNPGVLKFAEWNLGVKGKLGRDEIYDHL